MNFRFSVSQRLNLAFLIMVALIITAVGVGTVFAISTSKSTNDIHQGAQHIEQVNQLQLHWFSIVTSIDSLIQTRSTSHQDAILEHTQEFNQLLSILSTQSIGISQESIKANRTSLENVQQISQQLDQVVQELNQFTTQGRWGSALTLRQTELTWLQKDLDAELSNLSKNIQQDVNIILNKTVQSQRMTRIYFLILSVLAITFASLVSWLAFRSIVRPVNLLIVDVQRITDGDLSPTQPLEQKDEIGDLSRAFSLMTEWLRDSYENLERRVEERTQDLQRRMEQVQVAAEVARDITTNRDLENLLNHTVALIPERFGVYHAGIFMVDARGEFAVLRSATKETGKEMLALNHKLRIGETGLVGHVCSTGEARIALDVGEDSVHFKNPHLPLTRSEIALPLRAGDRVIGALDVQSTQALAFDQDTILILQVIADQLATAIENSWLFQELQDNILELETITGSMVHDAWHKHGQSKNVIGYEYDGMLVKPIFPNTTSPGLVEEITQAPITVPIKIRDQSIGNLEIWPSHETISTDEMDLLKDLSNRISQVLENARLFDESKKRAEREKLTGEITAHLRESNDPQKILETAVVELRKALQAKRAQISVHHLPDNSDDSDGIKNNNTENLLTVVDEGAPS